ncbi:MAG: hypothetical protein ACI909_004184 [Planctomycetota bacterium]|jgi:hypothetical protein
MQTFDLDHFQSLLKTVTDKIAGEPLDNTLEIKLNKTFPPQGEVFSAIKKCCQVGISEGILCKHEAGGIKFGRIIKATDDLDGHSVDVVEMQAVVGPHHRHPNGEIDLIMPLSEQAEFDGHGAGWLVYGPDSAHCPTVTDGSAIVLYLLPQGAIEFTRH